MAGSSSELYIYIPGLGDSATWLRKLAIYSWRLRGVKAVVFASRWQDKNETAQQKQHRLYDLVSEYPEEQNLVFVGESAGGSLAILASIKYSSRSRFITVCGYNIGCSGIHKIHDSKHPALRPMVAKVDNKIGSLNPKIRERSRVLYSEIDEYINPIHTFIKEVPMQKLPKLRHAKAIIYCLLSPHKTITKS